MRGTCQPLRQLTLITFRAHLGQHLGAGGSGQGACEIENAQIRSTKPSSYSCKCENHTEGAALALTFISAITWRSSS
jgi:hypothetical protein